MSRVEKCRAARGRAKERGRRHGGEVGCGRLIQYPPAVKLRVPLPTRSAGARSAVGIGLGGRFGSLRGDSLWHLTGWLAVLAVNMSPVGSDLGAYEEISTADSRACLRQHCNNCDVHTQGRPLCRLQEVIFIAAMHQTAQADGQLSRPDLRIPCIRVLALACFAHPSGPSSRSPTARPGCGNATRRHHPVPNAISS